MQIRSGPGARPGNIRRRPCTACGHRCGTSASAHPQRVAQQGPTTGAGTAGRRGRHRWGGRNGMADATVDLATVWDQIRERLSTSLSPQQNALLNLTRPLGLVEDTAVLAAPNEFTQTVLESRMRLQLAEALSAEFGRAIRVAVQLEDMPVAPPAPARRPGEPDGRRWAPADRERPAPDRIGADQLAQDRIAHDRASEELAARERAAHDRAAEDRADRDRVDDGRSAFGVRTDAARAEAWLPESGDGRDWSRGSAAEDGGSDRPGVDSGPGIGVQARLAPWDRESETTGGPAEDRRTGERAG